MTSAIILTAWLTVGGALDAEAPAAEVTPPPPVPQEEVMVDSSSPGLRVLGSSVGTILGAAATAATGALAAVGIGAAIGGWSGLGAAVITALAVWSVGYVFLGSLGGWLGQKVAGGQGKYGWTVLGALAGALVGGTIIYLGLEPRFQLQGLSQTLTVMGIIVALFGPILAVELSHESEVLKSARVGVAPLREGAAVAVSLRF